MIAIGFIILIAGIIFLLAGVGQSALNKTFQDAQVVSGTVINKRKRNLKNGTAYELTITYVVNGSEYSKVICVRLTEYGSISIGNPYPIKYRVDKPYKAVNPEVLDPKKAHTVQIFGVMLAGFGLVILLLLCGCRKSNDRPPDPGTPTPTAHSGTYACEYGELSFLGDGKTVQVYFYEEFAQLIGIVDGRGEFQYSFNWYDFGPCRYDVATKLTLFSENSDVIYSFIVESATKDTIILTYYLHKGYEHMKFQFQD